MTVVPQRSQVPSVGRVPYLDGVLLATRDQMLVVRGESQMVAKARYPQGDFQKRLLLLLQARGIPELYCPISARRGQAAAVGAELEAPDLLFVPAEYAHFPAGPRLPDPVPRLYSATPCRLA